VIHIQAIAAVYRPHVGAWSFGEFLFQTLAELIEMACTEKLQNPQFNPSNETKKKSNVAILSWQKKKKLKCTYGTLDWLLWKT
jgi:hypothetical protein